MCYFNRLTRVARWLADYPEWLQFCWYFVKPPGNDETALQHLFFLLTAVQEFFFQFHLCCMQFFLPTSAPSRVRWSAPKLYVTHNAMILERTCFYFHWQRYMGLVVCHRVMMHLKDLAATRHFVLMCFPSCRFAS